MKWPTVPKSFERLSLFPSTFNFLLGCGSFWFCLCSLNNSRSADVLFFLSTSLPERSDSLLTLSSTFCVDLPPWLSLLFLSTSALLALMNFIASSSFFHCDLLGGKEGTRTDLRRSSTSAEFSGIYFSVCFSAVRLGKTACSGLS